MSIYQHKWIEVLHAAHLKDWKIAVLGADILIEMPHITDLKLIRDNLPEVIGSLALDVGGPRERLKFIIKNDRERFEYILNPSEKDLGGEG